MCTAPSRIKMSFSSLGTPLIPRRICDSGATHSMYGFGEEPYLSEVTTIDDVVINGLDSQIRVTQEATHKLFGRGYYIPEYDGPTLVSWGMLLDTHSMHVVRQRDVIFRPNRGKGHRTLYAKLGRGNVYDILCENEAGGVFDTVALKAMVSQAHKREVVIRYHCALGHPSEDTMCLGVRSGIFSHLNITCNDIKNAGLRDCVGCLKGKMTVSTPLLKTPEGASSSPAPSVGEHLHVDLMFIPMNGKLIGYFIALDEASRFLYHQHIRSKGKEDILSTIRACLNHFLMLRHRNGDGRIRTYLHTDGESSIVHLARDGTLNGLFVEHVRLAVGVKDKYVERSIRSVKERTRSTVFSLDFIIPSWLLNDAVIFAILGLNQSPKKCLKGKSPWSIVHGDNGIIYPRRLHASFGAVGFFYDPSTKNNAAKSRAQLGIVIGREEHSSGVRAYLLGEYDSSERRVLKARFQPVSKPYTGDIKEALDRLSGGDPLVMDSPKWIVLESDGSVEPSAELLSLDEATPVDIVEAAAPGELSENVVLPVAQATPGMSMTGSSVNEPMVQDVPVASAAASASIDTASNVDGAAGQSSLNVEPIDDVNGSGPEADRLQGAAAYVSSSSASGSVKRSRLASGVNRGGVSKRESELILEPRIVESAIPNAEGVEGAVNGAAVKVAKRVASTVDAFLSYEDDSGNCIEISRERYLAFVAQRRSQRIKGDRASFVMKHHEALKLLALTAVAASGIELNDLEQSAIESELDQLVDIYEVLDPVDIKKLTPDQFRDMLRRAIGTVMLVAPKIAADGKFKKFKARFVIKEYGKRDDVVDAESPTVAQELVMIGLNYAASTDYNCDIMDVRGAFLEAPPERSNVIGRIDKELAGSIIRKRPELKVGLLKDGDLIVKLKRALYGLKDAPLAWFKTLSGVLVKLGFCSIRRDECCFVKHTAEGMHLVLVHVDDIFSTGPSDSMKHLRTGLKKAFKEVVTQENAENFTYLGFVISRDRAKKLLLLRQTKYIDNVLKSHPWGKSKEKDDPPHNQDLFKIDDEAPALDAKRHALFKTVVMTLLYVTKSRPDIKCVVIFLSTRLLYATVEDWSKLTRLVRYLANTRDLCLVIGPSDMSVHGSADASHGVHDDSKGHTGGVIWLGKSNAPILTLSKKQKLVARSSMEAEIVACDQVAFEGLWIKDVLNELKLISGQKPLVMQQDNQSAGKVLKSGKPSGMSKSVTLKHYWLTEQIQSGELVLEDTRSSEMIADGLTKPLPKDLFVKFRNLVLNLNIL